MTEFNFSSDWQNGEGIRGAELAATFASLRIDVHGDLLTEVFDDRARTVRDHIFVPLYPIAEWLASNWWFLAFEYENIVKKEHPAFSRRHSLRTGTDGYALPNLTITASGARTLLRWGDRPSRWTKIKFLNLGSAIVDREQFMQDCADFIDTVTRRLLAHDISETFLQDEWAAIQRMDEDEQGFCAMSAGLGWDPYALDDDMQEQVVTLAERLGELRGEAVPVIDSEEPSRDCSAILSAIEAAKPNELPLQCVLPLMNGRQSKEGRPWDVGYELARKARSELGLDGQPLQSTELLAEALSQDVATLRRATEPLAPLSGLQLVDGVVTRGASGGVSFGLKGRGEAGMRFLFCRALGEAISSRGDALVTRGTTPRQRRNRAFAAEFLAPSQCLKERITHSMVDEEQVDDLAEEFGVSTQVIVHQIENHRIAELAAIEASRVAVA